MSRPATAAVRLLTGEREPVRLATTADILLYGLQAIDGVPAEIGDRVLVKDQADPTQNGIYTASAGEWFRAADARSMRTLQKGTTVHTQIGTANADRVFEFTADEPVVGTDAITVAASVPPDIADAIAEVEALRDETQALKDAAEASAGQASASAAASAANAGQTTADRAATAADAIAAGASLAGAVAARDAALATGKVYAETTAGLAAVAEGEYFLVPSGDPLESFILYRDLSGVATEIKRFPSTSAVELSGSAATLTELSAALQYDDSGIAIAFDAPVPSILIKDAAAPAKRFFGNVTAKLTVTRTTAGWYFDKLGLLKQAGVNVPRFTYDYKSLAPRGLFQEPARANRLLQNRSLRITHQLTVSGGAGVFVDGETVNASGGSTGVYRSSNSTATIYALSGGSGTMTGTLTGAASGATKNISSSALVWVATNMTVAQDQVGLDGVANSASSITATADNATISQAITIASAAYFQTAYIARLAGSGALRMSEDGGATYTDVSPPDRYWNRMSIPAQTLANPTVVLQVATSGDKFIIDLAQNENGNFRTSPMVTTTAFFSRGGEQPIIDILAIPFNTALGSIFIEGRTQASDNVARTMVQLDDGGVNNQIFCNLSSLGSGQFSIKTAGAIVANVLPGLTVVDKTTRLAASWGPNYAQAALDGSIGAQDSALTVPTGLTKLRIGCGLAGGNPFSGTIAKLTLRLRTMDASELTAWSNFGTVGATPAIDVPPNDPNIEDSDHPATLTVTSAQVSGIRPISFGRYENANPGWRRRFKTRATSIVRHFQNLNTVDGSYNAKGQILVDGVHNTYFTSPQAAGKFFVRLDFASNADRLIEVVMPYSAAIADLGITTYGAPITLPPTRLTMPRAVFLGDSRDEGFLATSIDKTWMEILCRAKGWQHINLGYGSSGVTAAWGTDVGNANPDVVFITFDFNNRTGQTSLAGFKSAYKALVANIRAIKPTVKIYAVSSNWISAANDTLTLKIADYRQQELDAVSELTAAGDANIFYIDGLTLTANSTGSIGDGIHPNDVGSAEQAATIAPLVSV
ncbi:SGNH/GDSL hydrolase family protein [Mesorhizobium sp. M0408]|uniref:SGNH/GDSL hydrolase family protein n=1 Tax=Mesorhizobium sp. M0408 TaxID=2956942 RepID=UPI00333C3AB5